VNLNKYESNERREEMKQIDPVYEGHKAIGRADASDTTVEKIQHYKDAFHYFYSTGVVLVPMVNCCVHLAREYNEGGIPSMASVWKTGGRLLAEEIMQEQYDCSKSLEDLSIEVSTSQEYEWRNPEYLRNLHCPSHSKDAFHISEQTVGKLHALGILNKQLREDAGS